MKIDRNGSLPTVLATDRTFTGNVCIRDNFERAAPSRLAGATVTFAPSARALSKVNPLGQTLIVTSGVGRLQSDGDAGVEIRAGDIIRRSPAQRHWDGATPDHPMTYIAVHEVEDGRAEEFGGAVIEEEHRQGPSAA